jgi:ribose transport system substrate-binding protein
VTVAWPRRLLRATLLAPLLLAAGACGQSARAPTRPPAWLHAPIAKPLGSLRIGFASIGAGVNGYTAAYTRALTAYARDLGVTLIVLDAQADPVRQADQVLDLMAQQVDVLVIWPVNAKAVVSPIRQVHRAHIPVVITNSQVHPSGLPYIVSFSGPNDYAQAQLAAKLMVDALGGHGNVVMIDGTPGYTASELRVKGFLDYLRQHPGVHVLDQQPANWSREKAQSLMENYITRFGDRIDGVYSADSGSGIGAYAAARAAHGEGRLAHIPIFTDPTFTAAAYDAVASGGYYGSVMQSPIEDARQALTTAVLVAEHHAVPKTIFLRTPPVTRSTLAALGRPEF